MARTIPQAQFVVNAAGKKTGVLLSLKQYEQLLEDLHDLAVIAARRDEGPMSLEEIERRLVQLPIEKGSKLQRDNIRQDISTP